MRLVSDFSWIDDSSHPEGERTKGFTPADVSFRSGRLCECVEDRETEVEAKYARGAHLGPLLGSVGHRVRVLLDNGELHMIVAPGLKLLYPLRFESRFLPGCTTVEGFIPPRDGGTPPPTYSWRRTAR